MALAERGTVGRRSLLASGAVFSLAILVPACAWPSQAAPTTILAGTQLNGKATPDFNLVTHTGHPFVLSSLRGKPVVLTFLYTSCPDTCPIVTEKFATLAERLGSRAAEVAFLAVSVDPERDMPVRVDRFLSDRGLGGVVEFLTGERAALEAVWNAYYVGVTRLPIKAGSPESRRYGAYAIGHSDAIYLVDKAGRQRAFMRSDFALEDMLANLEVLLAE